MPATELSNVVCDKLSTAVIADKQVQVQGVSRWQRGLPTPISTHRSWQKQQVLVSSHVSSNSPVTKLTLGVIWLKCSEPSEDWNQCKCLYIDTVCVNHIINSLSWCCCVMIRVWFHKVGFLYCFPSKIDNTQPKTGNKLGGCIDDAKICPAVISSLILLLYPCHCTSTSCCHWFKSQQIQHLLLSTVTNANPTVWKNSDGLKYDCSRL